MRHSLKFSKKIGYFPHSEVPSQGFGKEIGHKHSEYLDLKLSPNTWESLGYVIPLDQSCTRAEISIIQQMTY